VTVPVVPSDEIVDRLQERPIARVPTPQNRAPRDLLARVLEGERDGVGESGAGEDGHGEHDRPRLQARGRAESIEQGNEHDPEHGEPARGKCCWTRPGQERFERDADDPDRRRRGHASGRGGEAHNQPDEGRRGNAMRKREASRPGQDDGGEDRRDQAGNHRDLGQRGNASPQEVRWERYQRDQACEDAGGDEPLVQPALDGVVPRGFVDEAGEASLDHGYCFTDTHTRSRRLAVRPTPSLP
jgi:hypothetical protein